MLAISFQLISCLRVEPSSKHNIYHHHHEAVLETETARILKGEDHDWNNEAEDRGIIAENKKTGQVTMETYKGQRKWAASKKPLFCSLFSLPLK